MKLTIENKILIPFVILFLLSQIMVLATTFRNDYHLIINNQYRNMDVSVQQLERNLNYSFEHNEMSIEDRTYSINKIKNIMDEKIIIEWNGQVLLNESDYKLDIKTLKENGVNDKIAHLQNDDYLFSYYYYAPLGWSLTILEDKKTLLLYFYESYKYNILTGIIFLTLSLQITVFVAANITNPIKKLVRFCTEIGVGKSERIFLNRKDEIGQLNNAFNQMLDQLDSSMEELLLVKNYNQNILNSIEKGIVTFDKSGKRVSSNPYANEMINKYKMLNSNGKSLEKVIDQLIDKVSQSDIGLYEQLQFIGVDTSIINYLDCYMSVMHDEQLGVQGYICSFNDVTERKRFEERMQRLDRLATAGRLASGVAHEIRNPLTGMRMSMQVLKKRLDLYNENKNIEIIERTIKEIDRINQLISDLLGYSKPSAHAPKLVLVTESVNAALALLENDFTSRGIQVETIIEKKDIHFLLDANHFHQILLNIIKNSVDAISDAGTISIYIRAFEKNNRGEVEIVDNGVGIALGDIGKIFDPFFTLKNDGTGLGMSVVHELIHRNSGEIRINSELGQGTTVTCNFELGRNDDE